MLEAGLPGDWPEEASRAARPFLQGHLIEGPPIFYAANLEHAIWSLSHAVAQITPTAEWADALVDIAAEQRPPFGIITTQTCDITEEDRRPRQPWLHVAPVFRFDEGDAVLDRDYIVPLDPPDLGGSVWAGDLRLELPLEKSVLVGRDPIEAFRDEDGYIAFGNLLARRRGRPALASVFHEVLNVTSRQLKEEGGGRRGQARQVRKQVYKLMLAIQDGTRLAPRAARLHVVLQGDVTPEIEDWFGEWWDRARLVADEAGLQLLPVDYIDARHANLVLYDRLVEIRNPI